MIRTVYMGLDEECQQGVLVTLFVGSRVWYLGMRLPLVWLVGIGGSEVPAAHIFTVFLPENAIREI
jgi:hypothetical protein